MMDVSVIIATCNRPESLLISLKSLDKQSHPVKEVIIVDASEPKIDYNGLAKTFPKLNIKLFTSRPSVCVQRNIGIGQAKSSHILLCDDDIEPERDYINKLSRYLKQNPEAGIVSGLVMQKDEEGNWQYQYPLKSVYQLIFRYIFQLGLWGELDRIPLRPFEKPILKWLKRYYDRRGNAFTKAGWPLMTSFSRPVFKTSIYGIGASIVKKEWLLNNLYDETLDTHGIGENYGICLGFPIKKAVHVLTTTHVFHHQVSTNRLRESISYYRRVLALHYFLKSKPGFNTANRLWFLWSLVGNLILSIQKKDQMKVSATIAAIKKIVFGANPYVVGAKRGKKVVMPFFDKKMSLEGI